MSLCILNEVSREIREETDMCYSIPVPLFVGRICVLAIPNEDERFRCNEGEETAKEDTFEHESKREEGEISTARVVLLRT